MRIDQSHHPWALAALIILGAAVIAYVPYFIVYPGGASGNTWPGLIYGVLGYLMMLYAGLMGARKKVPLWRVGRAQTWMRGHIWLGALSFPMILLHSGFHARGPLTKVLMTLLVFTVFSGVTGAMLQHSVPKRLTATVQLETIYEQIPEIREQLRSEATSIVDGLCGEIELSVNVLTAAAPGTKVAVAGGEEELFELTADQRVQLREVYVSGIVPFLRDPDSGVSPLRDALKAKLFFDGWRKQSPAEVHEAITDLENICEEERQLILQRRMYWLLHGWLLVHVPLSITLLVMGGIHTIVALHY